MGLMTKATHEEITMRHMEDAAPADPVKPMGQK